MSVTDCFDRMYREARAGREVLTGRVVLVAAQDRREGRTGMPSPAHYAALRSLVEAFGKEGGVTRDFVIGHLQQYNTDGERAYGRILARGLVQDVSALRQASSPRSPEGTVLGQLEAGLARCWSEMLLADQGPGHEDRLKAAQSAFDQQSSPALKASAARALDSLVTATLPRPA